MEVTRTIIIGTGGMGRETLWLLRDCNAGGCKPPFVIEGFVTCVEKDHGRAISGVPVLGPEELVIGRSDVQVVCAIGNPRSRRGLVLSLLESGVRFATVVHPSTIMAQDIQIGDGSIISANVTFSVRVRVASHCIVNVNCSVPHDCVLEDFATLGPGVNIAGYVKVGYGAEMGIGSVALPRLNIGPEAIVGGGAVVIRDVQGNNVVAGVPANKIRAVPEDQWL